MRRTNTIELEGDYLIIASHPDSGNYQMLTERDFLKENLANFLERYPKLSADNVTVYELRRHKKCNQSVLHRTSLLAVLNKLSERDDEISQAAARFIRNTVGIANSIEATGCTLPVGYDLIGNILHPKFSVEVESD